MFNTERQYAFTKMVTTTSNNTTTPLSGAVGGVSIGCSNTTISGGVGAGGFSASGTMTFIKTLPSTKFPPSGAVGGINNRTRKILYNYEEIKFRRVINAIYFDYDKQYDKMYVYVKFVVLDKEFKERSSSKEFTYGIDKARLLWDNNVNQGYTSEKRNIRL